jgi:hypothetical protein
MRSFTMSPRARTFIGLAIGCVWVFHGLYSKILEGIPRHRAIVSRILGEDLAQSATIGIGIAEVLLGIWALTGWNRRACAFIQTLAIAAMNTLEIIRANDLLISAPGMVLLNAAFLSIVWFWAGSDRKRAVQSPPAQLPHSARGKQHG